MHRAPFPDGCQVIVQIEGAVPQIGIVIGEAFSISGAAFFRVDTGHYEALFPPHLLVPYLGPMDA